MIKQRLVKNAIVDTDDVKIGPGKDFINWKPIIKRKLFVKFITCFANRLRLVYTHTEYHIILSMF